MDTSVIKFLPLLPIVAFVAYNITRGSITRSARLRVITPSQERVVLIGCTSGIGRQLAIQYAERRAKLMLFSRREDMLKNLKEECLESYDSNDHYKVSFCAGDATIKSDVERCVEAMTSAFGGVDTLIVCAGALSILPFAEFCGLDISGHSGNWTVSQRNLPGDPSEVIQKITEINYHAPLLLTRLFLPSLITTSSCPNIIVISSMAGKSGAPTRGLYAGSKHALHGFFDSLRVELIKFNVHVGLFCPATVDTDLRDSAVDSRFAKDPNRTVHGSTKGKLTPEACAKRIIKQSDAREREVIVPKLYYWTMYIKLLWPNMLDQLARKKYGF